jgi:hypothetical protein
MAPGPLPPGAHEWVSLEDPDEARTWVLDVTFLLSNWTCIYGRGCQGVLTRAAPELEQGCCSYGAHFTGRQDAERVTAAAATLDSATWQFKARARRAGPVKRNRRGEPVTRLVEGACIFLNRPGFPGGAGCALHRAALERGVPPMDYKPEVCWQLPLRRDDHQGPEGRVITMVGQWGREHWGAGGQDFHWWCTEAPEAFVGSEPVYRAMARELKAMLGPATYRRLARYLDHRRGRVAPLPHPVLRKAGRRRGPGGG